MGKIDELYDSLTAEQQTRITRQQFFEAIMQLEMEKLREMGLFNSLPLTSQEARDLIYNKVLLNYNNLAPDGSHRCMHNYCRNRDLKASHVLPAAALRLIAGNSGKKNNVLYTPLAEMDADELRIITLGIGKAFRFPGFCEKHENWFDFEKEMDFVSDQHAYKQVFRSICYDQFLQQLFLKQEKLVSKLMLEKVKEKATHMIREHTLLEIELTNYQNRDTKNMLTRLRHSIKRANLLLKEFKVFKKTIWKAIRNIESDVFLWQGETDIRVPIALTHCGTIKVTNREKTYRAFGAIVLMPVSRGSILLICTPNRFKRQINYMTRSFKEKGYFEHFIFHAMAGLTDNWLVKPEFWDNELSQKSKKEILAKRNWERPE